MGLVSPSNGDPNRESVKSEQTGFEECTSFALTELEEVPKNETELVTIVEEYDTPARISKYDEAGSI